MISKYVWQFLSPSPAIFGVLNPAGQNVRQCQSPLLDISRSLSDMQGLKLCVRNCDCYNRDGVVFLPDECFEGIDIITCNNEDLVNNDIILWQGYGTYGKCACAKWNWNWLVAHYDRIGCAAFHVNVINVSVWPCVPHHGGLLQGKWPTFLGTDQNLSLGVGGEFEREGIHLRTKI